MRFVEFVERLRAIEAVALFADWLRFSLAGAGVSILGGDPVGRGGPIRRRAGDYRRLQGSAVGPEADGRGLEDGMWIQDGAVCRNSTACQPWQN